MATTNKTNSTWSKYFYSGIGFAAHSKDIVQKSVDEFVKNGKVNHADGKKIVDSAIQKLEAGYSDAVHKVGKYSATEINSLKNQIAKLEKQLLVKSSGKKSVTPSPAKKKSAKKKAAAK